MITLHILFINSFITCVLNLYSIMHFVLHYWIFQALENQAHFGTLSGITPMWLKGLVEQYFSWKYDTRAKENRNCVALEMLVIFRRKVCIWILDGPNYEWHIPYVTLLSRWRGWMQKPIQIYSHISRQAQLSYDFILFNGIRRHGK